MDNFELEIGERRGQVGNELERFVLEEAQKLKC